jgi:hypothetical protein
MSTPFMAHHKPSRERRPDHEILIDRLESLLRRIHKATGEAIREIDDFHAPRSHRWRCIACNKEYHFTQPKTFEACDKCPDCGGTQWIPIEFGAPRLKD